MNDVNKPFFKEPEGPKEVDIAVWLVRFYDAWEREFHIALGSIDIIVSDDGVKSKLMEKKAAAEWARDQIVNLIFKENKK